MAMASSSSWCVGFAPPQRIQSSPWHPRRGQHFLLSPAAEARSSVPSPSVASKSKSKSKSKPPLKSLLWGSKAAAAEANSERRRSSSSSSSSSSRMRSTRAQANDALTSLAIAVGVPLAVGGVNALINNPFTDFYRNLKKPSFNPPNWLFGLAWSVLYAVMGLASWLVWAEGGLKQQAIPLTAYGVQLVLNLLWPPIFFTAHNIRLAFIDLAALVVAVAVTILLFKPVNPLSAYLLLPYLAWVSFAAFLNYSYLSLNGPTAPQQTAAAAA